LTAKTAAQTNQAAKDDGDARPKGRARAAEHARRRRVFGCQNRYDAQNTVTHEAGHFFGLGEDVVERKATMFQSIDQCETHKRLLANTDVSALATLYAASADTDEAKAGPRACSVGRAPGSSGAMEASGALLVSAGIFGLALLRRRRFTLMLKPAA